MLPPSDGVSKANAGTRLDATAVMTAEIIQNFIAGKELVEKNT